MTTPREQAHLIGATTYLAGRPCGKRHQGERYVSNGMCVDCLREKASQFKNNRRQSRINNNLHKAGQLVDFTITIQHKHTQSNVHRDLQTLLMGPQADSVITWLHHLATMPLGFMQLSTLLGWDGSRVTVDITQLPQRHTDEGLLVVALNNNWYVATELMEVLRSERDVAERYHE